MDGVTTAYLHDGDREIGEYDAAGTLAARHVYGAGLDEPVAMIDGAGALSYVNQDGHGSVVEVTGAIDAQFAYGPYGETAAAAGYPFRYAGRRFEPETGLYDDRARMYAPALGRFMQPDPIGTAGGINLYAYVGNDPLNCVDPQGLMAESAWNAAYNLLPSTNTVNGLGQFAIGAVTSAGGAGLVGLGGGLDFLSPATGPAAPATAIAGVATITAGVTLVAAGVAEMENGLHILMSQQSPEINPSDVTGKTPAEIDRLARGRGLIPRGPDPLNGRGAYVDPVTGKQRVLIHPDEGHAHVNNSAGERLGPNGDVVAPESPEAHLPLGK